MLLLAPSPAAADELLRLAATGPGAAFGWHRATPGRLAAAVLAPELAREDRAPVGRLACVAVVARVVQRLAAEGGLGRYADAAAGPTFARAGAAVLEEVRLAGLAPDALESVDPGLAALASAYDEELSRAGLIDRAGVLARAAERVRDASVVHPLLDLPLLSVDLPVASAVEADFVAAVAERAPELVAVTPTGDEAAERFWTERLKAEREEGPDDARDGGSLVRLQRHLFEDDAPEAAREDGRVVVLSAPGESRECVEIARRLHGFARDGVPFDRMAVLLRSVDEYRPHLEEALARAGVPAWFARGATRPDPAGRAFFALLACRAERLSARRFAEYLSLGEVPEPGPDGAPPLARPPGERWVAPDDELLPEVVASAIEERERLEDPHEHRGTGEGADPETAAVTDGVLRAPHRWEQLLVEAAVIGGRDRWVRRLDGLAEKLRLDIEELAVEGVATGGLQRDLDAIPSLRAFALPVLDELLALPERAPWGEWTRALAALATRCLRRPERVLSVLAELEPMAEVGPVDLATVQRVLADRLLQLSEPPAASRQGSVFVGPADAARGLCFDVVFVPGLAERLFPRKISEEPLLLDAQRRKLGSLRTNAERVAEERMLLRLATGAASRAVLLSYPRLDLDQSRPRVPSFYALEALRAAEGRLPGFDALAARAEEVAPARVGWPAPEDPADAIDEAEHDLALLARLLIQDEEESVGTARYLLGANPHLGRALRFRARRWLPAWTQADGLTPPVDGDLAPAAVEEMARHSLAERSYSATALQNFASCPYRFFLQAIHRLQKREEPEAIDEMDPLQRGSLVHDIQQAFFERLREEGALPVTPASLELSREILDAVVEQVAAEHADRLAPAIPKVWEDGVTGVRADLREWLRRMSEDESGFVPWAFELSFGLARLRDRDDRSRAAPVSLDCGLQLRGSIDLVERRPGGGVRITDHKTGRASVDPGLVIGGGTALQPVLYALAAEKLLPGDTVESGRLWFCTSAGGFEERTVALDEEARAGARTVAETVDRALAEPFLPAAPAPDACRFCDYRSVCGPYEELRVERKYRGHEQIRRLTALRETP